MTSETQLDNVMDIIFKYPKMSTNTVLNNQIKETNIMALLFSSSFVPSDNRLIEYILIKDASFENIPNKTKYYDYNFDIYIDVPLKNTNIVDLDLSYLNTQNIIKYYFLLDTLSQIYGNFTKNNINNILTIKSRYYIYEDKWSLYKKDPFYTFKIEYQYNEDKLNYILDSVQAGINIEVVKQMLTFIDKEIYQHLLYIYNTDIKYNNREYFKNNEFFYRFCRLKLKYYTLQCVAVFNKDVNKYIDTTLTYCFMNMKNSINIVTDNTTLSLTNTVIKTKDDVKSINNLIEEKHKLLVRNNNNFKKWNNNINIMLYLTIIISIIIILVTIIINNTEIKIIAGNYTDIFLVIFIIIAYILISYFISLNRTEYFTEQQPLYTKGLRFRIYNSYFNNNVNWFRTKTPIDIGITTEISNITTGTSNKILDGKKNNYSIEWFGYLYANISGTWTFYTKSDNASYIWIGNDALINYNDKNAIVNNGGKHILQEKSGTIELIQGEFYPIRIQFGNNNSNEKIIFSWIPPNGIRTYNGDGLYFLDTPNGLSFKIYKGYFNDDIGFFKRNTPIYSGITGDISNIYNGTNGIIPLNNSQELYSIEWFGYFYANATGKWTFYTNSDDASYLWIGENAQEDKFVRSNSLVNNGGLHGMREKSGTINLEKGKYYQIRIQFGENTAADNISVSWSSPNGKKYYIGKNFLFDKIPTRNIPQNMGISTKLEPNITKYPTQPMTKNKIEMDGMIIRCKASTRNKKYGETWKLFNNNKGDEGEKSFHTNFVYNSNNGLALNTYFPNYPGEYVMIDLDKKIILKQIGLVVRGRFISRCPGIFRIYATNNNIDYNNNNFKKWNLIHDQTSKITEYIPYKSTIINIENNQQYSKYALVVKNLAGNDNVLNFSEFELYGIDIISSSVKQIQKSELPPLPRPIPSLLYDDNMETVMSKSQQTVSTNITPDVSNNNQSIQQYLLYLLSSDNSLRQVANIENQNIRDITTLSRSIKNQSYKETFQNMDNLQTQLQNKEQLVNRYKENTEEAIADFNNKALLFLDSKIKLSKSEIKQEFDKFNKIFTEINIMKNEIDIAIPKFDKFNNISDSEVKRLTTTVISINQKQQSDLNLSIQLLQQITDRLLTERFNYVIYTLAMKISSDMRKLAIIEKEKQNIIQNSSQNVFENFITRELSTKLFNKRKIEQELENLIDSSASLIENIIIEMYTAQINNINEQINPFSIQKINIQTELQNLPKIENNSVLEIFPPNSEPTNILGNNTNITTKINNEIYIIVTSSSSTGYSSRNLIDNNFISIWKSSPRLYSPTYIGPSIFENIRGEWIIYKLPEPIHLHKYTFLSTQNRPRTWKTYASNDGEKWILLEEASQNNELTSTNYVNDIYTKQFNKTEAYQFFAFVITSITDNISDDGSCSLGDIRLYGELTWLSNSLNLKDRVIQSKQSLLNNKLKFIDQINGLNKYVQDNINNMKKSVNIEFELLKKSYELYIKFTKLQEHKYANDIYSIETTVPDIKKTLTSNIHNIVTIIANNIVLSGLKNEGQEINEQKNMIKSFEYKSNSTYEDKKRDEKIKISTSYFILRLFMLTCILIILIRNFETSYVLSFIFIILYILIFSFYIIDIIKIVRTDTSNIYWGKPNKQYEI